MSQSQHVLSRYFCKYTFCSRSHTPRFSKHPRTHNHVKLRLKLIMITAPISVITRKGKKKRTHVKGKHTVIVWNDVFSIDKIAWALFLPTITIQTRDTANNVRSPGNTEEQCCMSHRVPLGLNIYLPNLITKLRLRVGFTAVPFRALTQCDSTAHVRQTPHNRWQRVCVHTCLELTLSNIIWSRLSNALAASYLANRHGDDFLIPDAFKRKKWTHVDIK